MNVLDLKYLLEEIEERNDYEEYLTSHIDNVQKAYSWMKENMPELLSEDNYVDEIAYYGELDDIISRHDSSKRLRIPDSENYYELKCEYDAYADYFYSERTPEVKEHFNRAWLSHIHQNPHHWQHWILHKDNPSEGIKVLDMPYVFIIECLCDWWSFSWKSGNLYEVFDWYNKNKDGIVLSDKTREKIEYILEKIKEKLGEK